jgi:hypothetical protein
MFRNRDFFGVLFICTFLVSASVFCGCLGSRTAPSNVTIEPVKNPNLVPVPVSTANITIIPTAKIDVPTYSVDDVKVESVFYPTGYMGTPGAISVMRYSTNNPHSPPTSMRVEYFARVDNDGWAGVYWQYPDNNWGEQKGYNLSGHDKLTFFARGEEGQEIGEFSVGGIKGKYNDTISTPITTGPIHLTKEWKQYVIDLRGKNLNQISGGFCVVVTKKDNPAGSVIYIDDLYYQ